MARTYTAAQVESALRAPTQAVAARALGWPGRTFRDITRDVFGVHTSRDPRGPEVAWGEVRPYTVAYATRQGDARRAVVAAWNAGTPVPPHALADSAPRNYGGERG